MSRLHSDVEREVIESRMFARWAVIGENVNATVATFREFGSRPRDLSLSRYILILG